MPAAASQTTLRCPGSIATLRKPEGRTERPMSLKLRLIVMNFLQFFIWGSWLLTIGAYWFQNKHWSGTSFGAIFSTMGIASLFMPSIAGIIADKWNNAERL
jgi:NHS family xanthosine MFS transporter